jgi:hypothetical protein
MASSPKVNPIQLVELPVLAHVLVGEPDSTSPGHAVALKLPHFHLAVSGKQRGSEKAARSIKTRAV